MTIHSLALSLLAIPTQLGSAWQVPPQIPPFSATPASVRPVGRAEYRHLNEIRPTFAIPSERLLGVVESEMKWVGPIPQSRMKHASARIVRNEAPLFGPDGPHYKDVRQGDAGDCFLLALLASLAKHKPDLLESAIQPVGGKTSRCLISFYDYSSGEPRSLELPNSSYVDQYDRPIYAGNRIGGADETGNPIDAVDDQQASWVKVFENFFALENGEEKLLTQYAQAHDFKSAEISKMSYSGFEGISHGGWASVPFKLLTGREMVKMEPQTFEEFLQQMASVNEGNPMVLVTKVNTSNSHFSPQEYDLILPGKHAYAVLESSSEFATLYNPDGRTVEIEMHELFHNTGSLWSEIA